VHWLGLSGVRKCMYRITPIALDWFVRCPVGNVSVFGVTSSALDWDVRCPVGNVFLFTSVFRGSV
jgi:hypothetical protein